MVAAQFAQHGMVGDFKVALSVQYLFWTLGVVQVLRFRRRAITHLDRVHPGATDAMRRGEPWVLPAHDAGDHAL